MAQPDPSIIGDPGPLCIRPAVGEPASRLLQGGGRDRPPRGIHRDNPAHAEPPLLDPARIRPGVCP